MKPILYSAKETAFKSNGIGRLADAMECTVTEERNGIFELNMKYPISGQHFQDLVVGNIILAKPSWTQNPQPFDIRTVTPSTDGMRAEVYAQHISYRLADIPVKPFEATGIVMALNGLVTNSMIPHDFDVWTDITNTDTKFSLNYPKSFRACLGGTEGSILQMFSGSGSLEFLWEGKTVKVYRHRGTHSGVSIRYGKNLTSLKQETSIENCYTGVIAYWADRESGESVNSEIQYVANHQNYAHERIYLLDVSSNYQNGNDGQAKPTVEQLNADAKAYIDANDIGTPSVNLEVSFIDLSQTEEYKNVAPLERVNLCDTVNVYFPKLGVNAESKVIKTVWNVLKDRYDRIELGDSKSNLSDTIQQTVKDAVGPEISELPTKSDLENALQEATSKLIGGSSGHMVVGLNANGEADQLFFMDTTNPNTAKNVLRLNVEGIGFSSSGFNGPYVSAWTLDSQFVADFITTGTLRANLIKAGVLSDGKGLNYWNLENGEFRLTSAAKVDDETVEQYVKDAAIGAVNGQTQIDIFNKLTNNGTSQGIFLKDGQLYINASMINTGLLTDAQGINSWNLETGEFHLGSNATLSGYDNSETVDSKIQDANKDVTSEINDALKAASDAKSATEVNAKGIQDILKYLWFDGNGLHLGQSASSIRMDLTNDRLSFVDKNSSKVMAYFSSAMMYILSGVFVESLRIGDFGFVPRANGSLDFKKVV